MPPVAGRPPRAPTARSAPIGGAGRFGMLVALALLGGSVIAACSTSTDTPASTQQVAGATDASASREASPATAPGAATRPPGAVPDSPTPSAPTSSSGPAVPSSITPGAVDRSTLEVTATYRVQAAITVRTGALDVSTTITVRNDSGAGIDRLELNTVAARLGGLAIVAATVDEVPVDAVVRDQTIRLPLGGVLADGSTATVRIQYRATLRKGVSGSDWMFSRADGTLSLHRWIPWVSVEMPFERPNAGQPFLTPTSPQVDVELLTDEPMALAAPSADIDAYAAGGGSAWSFSVSGVRDVAIVLAPELRVARGEAEGVPVQVFSRPGGPPATQLLDLAVGAIRAEADQLGMAFPGASMTVVDTAGGVALESPGMVWVPRGLDTRNRTYAIYIGVAHQWFYGLVGSDQRAEPFADAGPADLLVRTTLGTLRASRCSQGPLDQPVTAYSSGCYYEVVHVQGGRVLDELRRRMGSDAFWAALRAYLEAYRGEIGGTRQLLEALRAGTDVNLLPVLRSRFPSLY